MSGFIAGYEGVPDGAFDRPPDLMWLRWRCGRKVGRTIYAVLGKWASDDDPLIGVMDTVELAREAVLGHNNALEHTQREKGESGA